MFLQSLWALISGMKKNAFSFVLVSHIFFFRISAEEFFMNMLKYKYQKYKLKLNIFPYQTKSTHTQLFSISWTFWYLKWQVTELNWDVKESIKSHHCTRHDEQKQNWQNYFHTLSLLSKLILKIGRIFFMWNQKQQQLFDFRWWNVVVVLWHKNGF